MAFPVSRLNIVKPVLGRVHLPTERPSCSCLALWRLHPGNAPKRALICFTMIFTSSSSLLLCILDAKDQALQRASLCHVKPQLSTWKSQVTNSKASSQKSARTPPQPGSVSPRSGLRQGAELRVLQWSTTNSQSITSPLAPARRGRNQLLWLPSGSVSPFLVPVMGCEKQQAPAVPPPLPNAPRARLGSPRTAWGVCKGPSGCVGLGAMDKGSPGDGGTGQRQHQLLSASHHTRTALRSHGLPVGMLKPTYGSATDHPAKRMELFCLIWLHFNVCHLNNLSPFCSSWGLDRGCRKRLEINHTCRVSRQGASPGFVSWYNPVPETGTCDFMFPEDKGIQQMEQLWGFCRV